jgi:anti-sigma factor RsiW
MPNCQLIDPLVTPYVDGQLTDVDRRAVDDHLRTCPPCHSRVAAERAVHELLAERRGALTAGGAPDVLRARCRRAARDTGPALDGATEAVSGATVQGRNPARAGATPGVSPTIASWRARLAPLALAASLVLIVGIAFVYQLTASSSRVLAAELAADHLKCFAINGVLRTHQEPSAVESAMMSGFGWRMHLPSRAKDAGLELVGSRPCMYGEGKIAHIMYRHHGEPVSLFMLPRESRTPEMVDALGHKAAIWCEGDRTFVLLAREPEAEVAQLAKMVQQTLR